MDKPEEKQNSTRKSIASAVALVIALMVLLYAAPMLQEKLKEWSARQDPVPDTENVATASSPEVPSGLATWLPQIEEQLPKNDDGTPKYQLLHMRLSSDSRQLLLDLKETGEAATHRFDLILIRDKFGRYISENDRIPMKLYPPKK